MRPLRDPLGEGSNRWTKRLREDLGKNFELYQLSMPNKDNARYEEWKVWFERHIPFWRDGVMMVGWSLGGMFLVKYLGEEQFPHRIKKLVLLAAPCATYAIASETGNDCGSFQFSPQSLTYVIAQVSDIEIWHSEDDFVVPFSHALAYREAFPQAKLVQFADRNHFLQPEFPELVAVLKAT